MLPIEGLLPENDCELGTQWKGRAKSVRNEFQSRQIIVRVHMKRLNALSLGRQ